MAAAVFDQQAEDAALDVCDVRHQLPASLARTRSADKLSGTPLQLDSVGNPPGRRAKVLVVDDDPQVRALAARALTDAGFDVLEAADAVSASVSCRKCAVPVSPSYHRCHDAGNAGR